MDEIVPTILTTDIEDFSRKINALKGVCPRVQIDIIDGRFAPTKTIDLSAIRDLIDLGDLKIDLHLMVEEPLGWISRCLEIVPDRIVAQMEKMTDPLSFINEIIESGAQVGLALDLETPVENYPEDIYLLADIVVLLGVKAGKGGQELNLGVLEKIKKMREILGDPPVGGGKIGVDGGLNGENIKLCQKAGASIFYVGSYFWNTDNLQERYNELCKLIEGRQ